MSGQIPRMLGWCEKEYHWRQEKKKRRKEKRKDNSENPFFRPSFTHSIICWGQLTGNQVIQSTVLWDLYYTSVLERCLPYRESTKRCKERQGPTLGVRISKVSTLWRELTYRYHNLQYYYFTHIDQSSPSISVPEITQFMHRLSMITWVNVVLSMTVVDSQWLTCQQPVQ